MTYHVSEPVGSFVRACAAKTPTPGGGSGSALIAATGAALGAMAARFTVGRKGYEEHSAEMEQAVHRLDDLRDSLLRMVDLDCAAYGRLSAAFKLPKENDEQEAARQIEVRAATLAAMDTPLEAVRLCAEGLSLIAGISGRVNRFLVSDAGVCALALQAGLEGLALNVRINAAALRDAELTGPKIEELEQLRAAGARDRDLTIRVVDAAL